MTSNAKWGSKTVNHRYTREPPFLCGLASWQNQAFHKKGFHVCPTRRASTSRIGYYKNSECARMTNRQRAADYRPATATKWASRNLGQNPFSWPRTCWTKVPMIERQRLI